MNAHRIIQTQRNTVYEIQKYARLKPHAIVMGNRVISTIKPTQDNANSLANLEKGASGQYNGYMSPSTRRRVKGIIENFLTAIQLNTDIHEFPKSFPSEDIYPTFVTLTLPFTQLHCDNVIKKDCFFRFMEYLQQHWNVKNYIWVAETQKNTNIHFHVIIDRALPAERLNQVWNRHCERLGYVTWFAKKQKNIYLKGFKVRKEMLKHYIEQTRKAYRAQGKKFDRATVSKQGKKRQLDAYERGVQSNWNNPPSTKIHAIQSIKKLTAYVSKYMTKEPQMVNVPLAANEVLTQENGKYFITATTTEKVKSYQSHSTGNGFVKVVEVEHEITQEEKREITVKFDNRRLRGRIWGASSTLHEDKVCHPELLYQTYQKYEESTISEHTRKVEKSVLAGHDLFGRPYYEFRTTDETYRSTKSEEGSVLDQDEDAVRYLSDIQFAVPAHEINQATSKAGPSFVALGGKVIPLSTPQKDILPSVSAPVWARYRDHYRSLYAYLYPT